jgi:hypothetical protein
MRIAGLCQAVTTCQRLRTSKVMNLARLYLWIIICRSWKFHVPESNAFDARHQAAFSNEPVGLRRSFVFRPQGHQHSEDIGEMFVQSTGFAFVAQGAGVFDDSMLELVCQRMVC